jgi:hypothetical protein
MPTTLVEPIVEEYILDTREGRTVLRLVHSGISSAPDWDGFYESTGRGWQLFFRGLKHYLEHHPGKPRKNIIVIMQPLTESPDEGWEKLTGLLSRNVEWGEIGRTGNH